MTIETKVKEMVLSRYPSVRNFAEACGIKYSTMLAVFSRGFDNTGIENLRKICRVLGITMDGLARGVIEPVTVPENAIVLSHQQSRLLLLMLENDVYIDEQPVTKEEALLIDDQITAAIEIIRRQRKRREKK